VVMVLAERSEIAQAQTWGATCRIGADVAWSRCRLLDLSLDDALIELDGELPAGSLVGLPLVLGIESIAGDDVGITMQATIQRLELGADGGIVAAVRFAARREERMLLHLLVRLHELV
jgi:hypothetical protein